MDLAPTAVDVTVQSSSSHRVNATFRASSLHLSFVVVERIRLNFTSFDASIRGFERKA